MYIEGKNKNGQSVRVPVLATYDGAGNNIVETYVQQAEIIDDVTKSAELSAIIFKIAQPVGSILETTDSRNPASYYQTTASAAEVCSGACGTWERYAQGRVLVGSGTSDRKFEPGTSGGESQTTLTVGQMPSHDHALRFNGGPQHDKRLGLYGGSTHPDIVTPIVGNGPYNTNNWGNTEFLVARSAGNNEAHNNLQPYQVVYIWRRTA